MEKGVVEIGRDFLADFVGFERGVFFTIRKLAYEPHEVVEAYKAKDPRVCTPFSLIVLVFGIFFFIASQTGTDLLIFKKAEKLSSLAQIPMIATLVPVIWTNLPFILSLYVIIACSFMALFTKKLQLSFYDHVVANLYNMAVSMLPFSLLLLALPLIGYNEMIFYFLMSGMGLLIIKLKTFRLRIIYYYREEVQQALVKPMMLSGLFLAFLLLSPLFWLIFNGRI